MPIYAYRCAACGAEKDVLQKFSDAALTVCPVCATESFQRVLTAPAFQLKGSGWYVTDFRDGNKAKTASAGESASAEGPAAASGDAGAGKAGAAKSGEAGTGASTSKGPESSAAPAGTASPSGTA